MSAASDLILEMVSPPAFVTLPGSLQGRVAHPHTDVSQGGDAHASLVLMPSIKCERAPLREPLSNFMEVGGGI